MSALMRWTMKTMRVPYAALGALAWLGAADAGVAQEMEVDLELVLAVDVSRSMDASEQELQRGGYMAALRHPEVLAAIRSGFLGRIAVTYMQWAGPGTEEVVAPWTLVDGEESAAIFAAAIAGKPITSFRATSISAALAFSATLFDGNGFRASRQVIDVSGDGPNNMGYPVLEAREKVLARGITINGLPIMLNADYFGGYSIPDLDVYYEDCVIGGPGAFLVTVQDIDRIAEAIRRKLVLEIAGRPALPIPVAFPERTPRVDCMIGEKLRRRWMDP